MTEQQNRSPTQECGAKPENLVRLQVHDMKHPVKDHIRLLPSEVLEKCLEVSAFGVKAVSLSQDVFRADLVESFSRCDRFL